MAEIRVTAPKDLISVPVLTAGAGGVIALVGGDAVGGMIAGAAGIPTEDIGKMTAVKAGTKLGLGLVGTFLAARPGGLGNLGAGIAFGGLLGALSDAVNYGIYYATKPATAFVVTPAFALGYKVVRRVPLVPRGIPVRGIPTGQVPPVVITPPVERRIAGVETSSPQEIMRPPVVLERRIAGFEE